MERFWQDCLNRFKQELSAQQFNTWIRPIQFEHGDSSVIKLVVPNRFVQQWVRDKFFARIEELAKLYFIDPVEIVLELSQEKSQSKQNFIPLKTQLEEPVIKRVKSDQSRLNPIFTFENFVTGKANQLARAAALQVADNPGVAYNPLFIYGGVGLGKTHLIHAIGNLVQEHNRDAKISYLHAERYVSDVVHAYRHKSFDEFKRYYHSLDLLLIDDIQFFSGKTRTQEEFFYAFNALIESHKQVIITCDTVPKKISGMEDRLTSRFGWGLTVEIEPPELEMRVAILQKKAGVDSVALSSEVAFFIAKQIRSNVRELEGGLKRVIAYSRFNGDPITIDLVKEALKDILAVQNRQVSLETIQKTVADYYKLKVADMFSKKRSRVIARPRQIAMLLAKELTQLSYPDIGDAFGGRDHSTVIHAVKTINELKTTDTNLARDLSLLLQMLRN
ncbi:MAG: chromosomal replication initiator protein DnaA [Sulfurimonas sp.]|nr:chromosomal replication initiator protein DnaA [Sulfurimonas sp.]